MTERKIATIAELQAIQVTDNAEPLVNLTNFLPAYCCRYQRKDSSVKTVLVRQTVAERLQNVQARLQKRAPGLHLVVEEGYRSPDYQERYFIQQLLLETAIQPAMELTALLEAVHQRVALPSVAGHPTGGAIDVTIADSGINLDMGGAIADFSEPHLLPTDSLVISSNQQSNRMILHDLMVAEGFAPFYGEWWHFSYGDREWAAFYGLKKSLYQTICSLCYSRGT